MQPGKVMVSPNQVLTHAARAAATQPLCGRARRARREGSWSGQVMVEFGTYSTFRGWVRVRVLGYGSGVKGRKVKSRDCALASDLVRAVHVNVKQCKKECARRALKRFQARTARAS